MIEKTIPVPKEIIKAVNDNTLAVFIGAGVSRVVGCMGWDSLANNLIELCFTLKKNDSSTCINFKEKTRLLENSNHKKNITICYNILKRNGHEEKFYIELERSLIPKPELLEKQNIYNEIYGLRGLFITTNADQIFDDRFFDKNIIYREEDISPDNIDRNKLYHIHGSSTDRNSLVFTVPQYIQRYNNPEFNKFLELIFERYTVLFIGYGIAEFELLDFLITKFGAGKREKPKHFTINAYFRGEDNILGFDQYYYNEMGINVLGFELDEKGYSKLYDILEKWNKEINQTSAYLYDTYQRIENAARQFDGKEAAKILQIIKNDKPQEDHLFEELAKSDTAPSWLTLLYDNNYFNPAHNPVPTEVPGKQGFYTIGKWNVLDYLLNVAKINEKQQDKAITKLLAKIADSIIDYRTESGEQAGNHVTDSYVLKISFSLPKELITEKHIRWTGAVLKTRWPAFSLDAEIGYTVLPKLIQDNDKENILLLLDEILSFKKTKRPISDEFEPILDKYWFNKALKSHKESIARICGIKTAQLAITKMKNLIDEDDSAFNHVWIPTIEDHLQTRFTDKLECQLVHFLRDMLAYSPAEPVRQVASELLQEKHPIFRRIAIHAINVHYPALKDLFWDIKNPLNDGLLLHEIYVLLQNNCPNFTNTQIKKVLDWIETKEYSISDEIRDDKEKIIAYLKKEWISALLNANSSDVLAIYKKYDDINPAVPEHPGLLTWSESGFGTVSPIEPEELMKKSNKEIADYLTEFKGEPGWKKPSRDGLNATFRECIKRNPGKYSDDLGPFFAAPRMYQRTLLSEFVHAWRDKKDFSLTKVFAFIEGFILSDGFWNNTEDTEDGQYRDWLISQVCEFIQAGTRSDSNAFASEYLPRTEKLLLTIAENIPPNFREVISLYEAMVLFSLRYARLYKKDDSTRWVASIKAYFDSLLNSERQPPLDFYRAMGKYFLSITYLDKKWVTENIKKIFPDERPAQWKAAFKGYILYTQRVCQEVYFLLKDNGILPQAFQYDFKDAHVVEHLVQHICISYVEGWEKLDESDSLITMLVQRQNNAELSEMIRFLGTFRNNLSEEKRARIKTLWGALYKILGGRQDNHECQVLLSYLCRWIGLLDTIDKESLDWLNLSAKYSEVNYNVPFFIETLARFVKTNSAEVGQIYFEMLNANVYPTYDGDDIKKIVRGLYEHGQKETADKICIMHLGHGDPLLRPIYEEYNSH